MEELITLLSLIAFSALKFFLAVPAIVFAGYPYLLSVLISVVGGTIGFFAFFYLGEMKWIRYYFGKFMDWLFRLLGIERIAKEKKKFTKMNRFIVNVRGKYGLIGLAFLTPCIFSVPLGSLLAARYFDDNKLTIPAMIASIIFWSFALTGFYEFF